jgi:rare lipoprotein A
VPAAFARRKGGAVKNDLHTTQNWLANVLPAARYVRRSNAQRMAVAAFLLLVLSCCPGVALGATKDAPKPASATHSPKAPPAATPRPKLDHTGNARKGKASYYGQKFYSKKMADGTRMDPQSNAAASRTLPLGTKARVTNLQNGASEVVEIRDRGPYVENRIVDVTPKTADKLGLKEAGTAPVVVKPIEVPQPDGSVKPGVGAAQTVDGKSPADARDRRSPQ